jgi:hypothetical protein
MANIPDVPIDWANVSWLYVAVLALLVFVSTLFWTYYPHGLPLPTSASAQKVAPGTPAAPPPQAAPAVRPANPVTTLPQ